MASFVIHHTAGVQLIKKLKENFDIEIDEGNIYGFLFGNLIVDSSNLKPKEINGLTKEEIVEVKKEYRREVQKEKKATHFRDKGDEKLCVQSPNVSLFIEKYGDLAKNDFSALGYLFHLYTDNLFFNHLFDETFECLNDTQNKTKYLSDLKYIKIFKNNKLVLAQDLFNSENENSIYKDYTVMNKLILVRYNIDFDLQKMGQYVVDFKNPGIEEVNYQNISTVLNKTNKFISDSYLVEGNTLNVFKKEKVYDFIEYVGDKFINDYKDIILKLLNKNNEKKLLNLKN